MKIDDLISLLIQAKELEGIDGNTSILQTNWYYDMTDGFAEVDASLEIQVVKNYKKEVEGIYIFG